MSETGPVEQIADALSRLRLRGRPMHQPHGSHELHGSHGSHVPHGDARPAQRSHRHHGRRGSGGPTLGRLLSTLAAESAPLSVTDLADAVWVDQPRASRLVAQGVELGLLRREADPDDARRTSIALTESGARAAAQMREQHTDAVRTALDGFSKAEAKQFAALLGRFVHAWGEAKHEHRHEHRHEP